MWLVKSYSEEFRIISFLTISSVVKALLFLCRSEHLYQLIVLNYETISEIAGGRSNLAVFKT